ncbi:MAG: hypothetical protein KAT43_05085 [Nanoarchaeota archaeon]|nr:hypothetical protein [Nanoarchaeota archaeon]
MLKVEKNLDLDIKKFMHFFFDSDRKSLKAFMLRSYGALENVDSRDQMKDFVKKLYHKHSSEIDAVIREIRVIVDNIDPNLWIIMESILNEKFDSAYHVYPTMLPMSPYGKDYFNLSILANVVKNRHVEPAQIMRVCVHELSHLLYLKKLARLFPGKETDLSKIIGVNPRSLDGLKEIYAPIIQNNPLMRKFFPHRVVSNEEFGKIKVMYDGHIMTIEDYFIEQYTNLESQGLEKDDIDRKMIELLKTIDDEFASKLELYYTLTQNQLADNGFFNPIIIK